MPQPFTPAVMTDAGAKLLNKAQAGICKIEFTGIRTGNAKYSSEEKEVNELQKRTGLKSEKNKYPISEKYCESDKSIRLKSIISNQDPVTETTLVSEGYYVNEIGLYAKEEGADDSTQILYSISVASGENGDYLPPFNGLNPAQIIQNYHATVDNSFKTVVKMTGAALLAEDAMKMTDDTTNRRFRFGIDQGRVYVEEVDN